MISHSWVYLIFNFHRKYVVCIQIHDLEFTVILNFIILIIILVQMITIITEELYYVAWEACNLLCLVVVPLRWFWLILLSVLNCGLFIYAQVQMHPLSTFNCSSSPPAAPIARESRNRRHSVIPTAGVWRGFF